LFLARTFRAERCSLRAAPLSQTLVNMRAPVSGPLTVEPVDIKVQAKHLGELDKIHELLRALNDPYASKNIGNLVGKIPILAARCIHRATTRSKRIEINSLDHAINLIGNRGLESELFDLLEDLTVLKSKLENA
jgi:hypothetical protein